MNIMNTLTLRYLKENRRRTIITIIGIVLSTAMITAVFTFCYSFLSLMRESAIMDVGDWHICYTTLTPEQAEELSENDLFGETNIVPNDDGTYNLEATSAKKFNSSFADEVSALAEKYGNTDAMVYNWDLMRCDGLFASGNYYTTIYAIGGILFAIIMVGSVIVIANAFYISASERVRQYGVLKSVGATKKQVRSSVLFEGVALAAVSIPIGILAGYAGAAVVLAISNTMMEGVMNVPDGISLHVYVSIWVILAAAVLALITIMLSAWVPAVKTSRVSPVDAIRQTKEVRIRPSKVRTSPLTKFVFGFEGSLASKALKRSRGKYRATVISLTVSIVLFLTATSFGNLLSTSTSMAYGDYQFSNVASISGTHADGTDLDAAEQRQIAESLAAQDGVISYSYYQSSFRYTVDAYQNLLSSNAEKYVEAMNLDLSSGLSALFVTFGDEEFADICTQAGVSAESVTAGNGIQAVLINNSGQFEVDGKKTETTPFSVSRGETVTVSSYYGQAYEIAIAGETGTLPQSMVYMTPFSFPCLVLALPQAAFDLLYHEYGSAEAQAGDTAADQGGESGVVTDGGLGYSSTYNDAQIPPTISFVADAEDPAAFDNAVSEITGDTAYYHYNVDEQVRSLRNVVFVYKLFIYGFVVLLSLIAVTSVIGTISTTMALRRREFGILRSVGMTPGGIRKMLNLESLFYGIRSLVFGIPIGLIITYLMYRSITASAGMDFHWPVVEMIVCAAAVFLLTFLTMHYARAKQRKDNIVDVIKGENL